MAVTLSCCDKRPHRISLTEVDIFWLVISVHGHLPLWRGSALRQEHLVKLSCSPRGSQEVNESGKLNPYILTPLYRCHLLKLPPPPNRTTADILSTLSI